MLKCNVLQLFYIQITHKGCETMTDIQSKQIREFRMKGVGYKSIASVLGLSRDSVRNYCKSHGLDGYATEVAANIQEQTQMEITCPRCGQVIVNHSQ